jgi:hypothetical protein
MMNRHFFILLGIVWGFFGILIIKNPTFYHSRFDYHFDFTQVKWPFGGALIVLGIFFIWSSFRRKTIEAEGKAKDDKIVLMCPNCLKPHNKGDCPALKCPECQALLEELSGFYERHPELKDSK